MGSGRLVTAKVTSPPESSQQTSDIIQQSADRRQEAAAAMSSGRRSVSWVTIPITRTVDTIMASVVEEIQQQQQQSPKRVRWSEELTQVRDISPRHKAAPFSFQSPGRGASSSSSSSPSPPRSSLT